MFTLLAHSLAREDGRKMANQLLRCKISLEQFSQISSNDGMFLPNMTAI